MANKAVEADDKDPSMEDILQSIKQIIADEDDAPAPAAPAAPPAEKVEEDILELTEMVQDDGSVVEVGAGGADVLHEIDALAVEETPAVQKAQEPPPEIESVAMTEEEPVQEEMVADAQPEFVEQKVAEESAAPSTPMGEGLVSQPVASSTRDIIRDKLLAIPRRGGDPIIPMRDGITVEDLVIEALQPMLKEWLDKNLQHTVEQIISKEIRRLMPNE